MNKIGIILITVTLLFLFGGAYIFTRPTEIPPREANTYEYFWGNGCPHCKTVDDFVATWDKKDSITIKKFEVWSNTKNAEIMKDRYNSCDPKPTASQMAVPFLVTPDGKCLMGDTPIIDLYKSL